MRQHGYSTVPSYAAQAFASCFAAITTEVAAATLGNRLGEAVTTRGAIGDRADAVAIADAVDQALAAGNLDDTNGGAQ